MTAEKKTLKFQMMMSPGEAELLDEWMFRHRLRSRAEAIRRLTQIGMAIDRCAAGEPGNIVICPKCGATAAFQPTSPVPSTPEQRRGE